MAKALGLFTILFLACGTAKGQSLRILPVQVNGGQGIPAAIQFYCTEKYSRKDCQNDILHLSQTLRSYHLEGLGVWSFVLASSQEWEPALRYFHLPAHSPVFSTLKGKMTLIGQAVFSGPVDLRTEMMKLYNVPADRLLDVVISHELGHAFCNELDEAAARVYGEELLRTKRLSTCHSREKRPRESKRDATITSFSAGLFSEIQERAIEPEVSGGPPENGPH